MKFFKTLGIYKASNVQFDPKDISAYSYGWWKFVTVHQGLVVFNTHAYSNTTIKHQHMVERLMRELGISIDVQLDSRVSLKHFDIALKDAIEKLRSQARELLAITKLPRTHAKKNKERIIQAGRLFAEADKLERTFK